MPPGFGLLAVALLFEGRSFLRSLGDGLVAVRFQQLPGVVLDFDFLHSHGVISSSASRLTYQSRESGKVRHQSRSARPFLAQARAGVRPRADRHRAGNPAPPASEWLGQRAHCVRIIRIETTTNSASAPNSSE